MADLDYRKQLTLSDFFDRTARLTGTVFRRGLVLGAVTMIPGGVVMGFAMRELFAGMADMMQRMDSAGVKSVEAMIPFMYGLFEFLVAYFLYLVGFLILHTGVIEMVDAEVHNEQRTWQEAFGHGWHAALRVLVQYIVFAFIAVSLFGLVLTISLGVMHSVGMTILLMAALVALMAYLLVAWSLGAQAVVCEQRGPINGMARSRLLVRGYWWRSVGVLLLFGILVQFAVMIISAPVQGFVFGSMFVGIFDMEKQMLSNPNDSSSMIPLLLKFSQVSWEIGLIQALGSGLATIVAAVYTSLLYFDLRARHGEFNDAENQSIV